MDIIVLIIGSVIAVSLAVIILNRLNDKLSIPTWIYHNCRENSKITFEDTDYDKDGNVMEKYDSEKFGHRETYRVYTCGICGKVTKERSPSNSVSFQQQKNRRNNRGRRDPLSKQTKCRRHEIILTHKTQNKQNE